MHFDPIDQDPNDFQFGPYIPPAPPHPEPEPPDMRDDEIENLKAVLAALEAFERREAELAAALEKYAWHTEGCPAFDDEFDEHCRCGYVQLDPAAVLAAHDEAVRRKALEDAAAFMREKASCCSNPSISEMLEVTAVEILSLAQEVQG